MKPALKETYIRAAVLIGFDDIVDDGGLKAQDLFSAVGVDVALLKDADAMIPYRKYAALLELAAVRLNRPSVGIEFALRSPEHYPSLGAVSLLGTFVPNVREWIAAAIKYWRYQTNAFTMTLTKDKTTGLANIRYQSDPTIPPSRQLVELSLANAVKLARIVAGNPNAKPNLVRFHHARPKDISLHESFFGCPIEFNTDHNEILFDPKLLDASTKNHQKLLKPFVSLHVRQRISQTKVYDETMTSTVAAVIQTLLGTGQCNLEFVASSLGSDVKVLQRRLGREGTTFKDILQNVRESVACRLLFETDISVERLAGRLDYSSTPPFTLAFKRWTDMTPLEYRRVKRENDGKALSRRLSV